MASVQKLPDLFCQNFHRATYEPLRLIAFAFVKKI